MILYPNAKINIGLNILSKRQDGFHELETLMYPISLTDILTINRAPKKNKKVNFSTTGISIDGDINDNLIVKAYNLLDKKFNLPSLDIHLHKSIPFGAGLGGGSADCAFAIKGINDLCELNLSIGEMELLAAELGSDCPFFINNKPAVAKGRGEIIEQFNIDLDSYSFVVIIPPIPISTKAAYKLVKPQKPNRKFENSLQLDINLWKDNIFNNFEDSVFYQYPEIKEIKEVLYKIGADYAALSGSGSAVFGVFKNQPKLDREFPNDYFVWAS